MKVGITYDLRQEYLAEGYSDEETAEFDRPETIDAIESTLWDLKYETDRIGHVRNLVRRLASGERWDLVFNIAEGLAGYGREAAVPALLDAYAIPYTFSDPLVLSLTLHKGMTKHVLRNMGIPTADFAVVEDLSGAESIGIPFPVFAKPVAEGTGKGIDAASRISTRDELLAKCRQLLETFGQPVLVERFLPGREFTVGVVGTGDDAQVIGVMEVVLKDGAERDAYSYSNKEHYEELVEYRLVDGPIAGLAARISIESWQRLGCRDGGRIDLRCDEQNVPNFVEVNPLAGLHPVHSDLPILSNLTGISYRGLIEKIIASAMKRINGR